MTNERWRAEMPQLYTVATEHMASGKRLDCEPVDVVLPSDAHALVNRTNAELDAAEAREAANDVDYIKGHRDGRAISKALESELAARRASDLDASLVLAALESRYETQGTLAEDGTVRTYDPVAGYFCRSSNSPSARAVKAAFTSGRTGTVRISCDG